jgi:cytochrome c oxidase subunit 2
MSTSRFITLILIALTIIGGVVLTFIGNDFWFPERASTVARSTDLVFHIITWISIFFFVLIIVVMLWFAGEYHSGKAPKATSEVTHNTPLELTWTIIPLILVIAIFYVGLEGYLHLRVAPLGSYEVRVTAQKWSWAFDHPNGASEANILRVPLGRPVKLTMSSNDVLHACFIPAFRVKQDIVPGRFSTIWFEANKAGEYDLFCAEYCGKDHSLMRAKVIVKPEAQFLADLKDAAEEHKRKPDSELAQYALDKLYPRCSSCHALDNKRGTGPSWRETNSLWGKERVFTDGSRAVVDENYIRDSLLNPAHHIVAEYTNAMPTFKGQLDDRQIFALILAIKNLQSFDNNGKLVPGSDAKIDWHAPTAFPGSSPEGPPQASDDAGTAPATTTSPAPTPPASGT